MVFSSRSVKKCEFSNRFSNICIDRSHINIKCTAVIAAISKQKGLIHWKQFEKSVNVEKFLQFLKELLAKFKKKDVTLFMDNLKVHHSKLVKNFCEKKGAKIIFNCAYFCDGNPIETIFSKVKRCFEGYKTNEVVNNGTTPTKALIDRSFSTINKEDCINSVRHALECFTR